MKIIKFRVWLPEYVAGDVKIPARMVDEPKATFSITITKEFLNNENADKKIQTQVNVNDIYKPEAGLGIWMQFTGMKAKKKEIYEGDILKNHGHPFQVVWMNGGFVCDNGASFKPDLSSILDLHPDTKVIGNIYENPELIPSEK